MRPLFSIIVVSYNSETYIEACLESVLQASDYTQVQVIVVDNASSDQTTRLIEIKYPQVELICNKQNEGFAKACNRGARKAQAPYLIFLNADALMNAQALSVFDSYLKQHPQVAIVGPQLMYPDGQKQNSIDNFPFWPTAVWNKSLLKLLHPKSYPSKYFKTTEPLVVDSVIGACLCIRASVFKGLKGFDQDYFFYLEETDLCYRAAQKGWKTVFLPQAQVVHQQGAAAKAFAWRARIEYYRGRYLFWQKIGYSARQMSTLKTILAAKAAVNVLGNSVRKERRQAYWNIFKWHISGMSPFEGLKYVPLEQHKLRHKGWSIQWNAQVSSDLIGALQKEILQNTITKGLAVKQEKYRKVLLKKIVTDKKNYAVFVKVYDNVTVKDWLKTLVLKSKGRTEYLVACELAKRKISVPVPVLFAEKRVWGGLLTRNIFINMAIEGAVDLIDKRKQLAPASFQEKQQLADKLGQMISDLHVKGFYHQDLHGGNILINPKGKLFLLDLHRSTFCKKLSLYQKAMNWAYLRSSISLGVSRSIRMRALTQYMKQNEDVFQSKRWFIETVDHMMIKLCDLKGEEFVQKGLTSKCVKKNSKLWVWGIYEPIVRKWIQKQVTVSQGELIKTSSRGVVWASWAERLKLCIKQGRGLKKEFWNNVKLKLAGVSVPQPIAYRKDAQQFISRNIHQGHSLDTYFYQQTQSSLEKYRLVAQTAAFIRDLHERGILHHDLKAANIIVRKRSGAQAGFQIFLIDNGRLSWQRKPLSWKDREKGLVQMNASFPWLLTDKERALFVRRYAQGDRKIIFLIRSRQRQIGVKTRLRWEQAGIRSGVLPPWEEQK